MYIYVYTNFWYKAYEKCMIKTSGRVVTGQCGRGRRDYRAEVYSVNAQRDTSLDRNFSQNMIVYLIYTVSPRSLHPFYIVTYSSVITNT